MEKKCADCEQVKSYCLFSKKSKNHYNSYCKECIAVRRKELRIHRIKNGLCPCCGKTPQQDRKLCERCNRSNVERQIKLRIATKERAIVFLGGKCVDCGLTNVHPAVYDFHHVDPNNKDFTVGEGLTQFKKWEKIEVELQKCILLCSNCHRVRHATPQTRTR
jgi:hypothetical protein